MIPGHIIPGRSVPSEGRELMEHKGESSTNMKDAIIVQTSCFTSEFLVSNDMRLVRRMRGIYKSCTALSFKEFKELCLQMAEKGNLKYEMDHQ